MFWFFFFVNVSMLNMKTAVITGASKGIGAAVAIMLAKEGYSVAINFKSDSKTAEGVLRECNKYSKENILVQADVSNEDEVLKMFKIVNSKFEKIDVIVNNAGVFDQKDESFNVEVFNNIYNNNFLSCILVTKYFLPLMGAGSIINISSVNGRLGYGRPKASAYSAFKAALENYTKNLAKDLAPKILVNAIAPGRVNTPMWNADKNKQKDLGKAHLIQRMIEPEEIANGVLFLINNKGVCGEILTIDGGYTINNLS